MSKQTRIAVVGTGWWATYAHIPGLLAHEGAELVALCDKDKAKVALTAAAYGIDKAYNDVETMLTHESLDGVIVATNHAAHYEVAKPCLERGIDVLIEKPMTLFAAEAKELVALAEANECKVTVGYNANYSAYARRAHAVLHAGDLGEVQYVSGIFNQHVFELLKGNAVIDSGFADKVHSPGAVYSDPQLSGGGHGHLQITHLAGLLFYLTNLRAKIVSARMRNYGLAVDLVNAILIEFESGAPAVLGGTGNMPGGRKIDLQIYCEHGWIDIDDVAQVATIQGKSRAPEHIGPETAASVEAVRYASTNNLVDQILGRSENGASGEVGWRVVELLEAAYRSARDGGRPVLVEELYAHE